MRIKINNTSKILKKSSVDDLPDFVVITGENGSGKTQLLNALSRGMYDMTPEMMEPQPDGHQFIAEIFDNGKLLSNINYVPVQGSEVNLGNRIDANYFVNNYGKLPMKYHSFLNLKRINPEKKINAGELTTRYKLDIGINNNNVRNYNPNISQSDINLFELIYSKKEKKYEGTFPEECVIHMPISNNNLFSANLTLLYLKHKCKLDLAIEVQETPWDVFNEMLEEAKFKYRLTPPDLDNKVIKLEAKLVDTENGNIIDIAGLSSGEKTIMSLILALYNSKNHTTFPEVILFDEPDSSLHPSMTKQMLDVLQNVFVKEKKVKVILTTHSPSTIALSPELSIYRMDRNLGHLIKEEKSEAIKSLTYGLDNLSIYFENRKQVFVESTLDKDFYEVVYSELKNENLLNKDIHLEFITMSENKSLGDENGGCDYVKKIVNRLTDSGNNTALGLIDYDNKNNGNDKVSILGQKKRYSIENYILDPIFLAFTVLLECDSKKVEFGFDANDKFINFQNIELGKLQNIIDNIISKIKPNIPAINSEEIIEYKTVNNLKIKIPNWYFLTKGHLLEAAILKGLYDLNSIRINKSICKPIIDKCIKVFPLLISNDILETFKELELK